jgi:predicted transcriptional regulator
MNSVNDILEWVKEANRPVSAKEISDALNITRASTIRALSILQKEGKVISSSGNETFKGGVRQVSFYTVATTEDAINKVKQIEVNIAAEQQEKINMMETRLKEVEEKEKKFYSEIVSIMGVFVAIFALIITNVEILQESIVSKMSTCELAEKIIIIDGSMILSIMILLLMVRWIINTPEK